MMINIAGPESDSTLSGFKEEDITPNAVDVRIDKLFAVSDDPFILSEYKKQHRQLVQIFEDDDGWFHLPTGMYDVQMDGVVTVAEDEAGWIVARSTLVRNGLFLVSGLYDSGYSGVPGCVLHVTGGPCKIARHTRIGQLLMFKANALKLYDGSYGIGKTEETQRYGDQ